MLSRLRTAAALVYLLCGTAQAHLLNMTTAQVDVNGDGTLQVDLKIDLTRAAGGSLDYYRLSRIAVPLETPETRALLDRLAAAVWLLPDQGPAIALKLISAELPRVTQDVFLDPLSWPMTHVVLRGRIPATTTAQTHQLKAVFGPTFQFEEPIALTFTQLPEKRRMTRWLVTSQESPAFTRIGVSAADAETSPVSLRQFVAFGFLHILPQGLDHVLFVLGLYLGARNLKSLLVLVTCFTLAHSITLALASIGTIRLSPAVVEPLISASIAWVGIENLFPSERTERYRPFLVFGFGLLHGMGFAGALSMLDTPQTSFLPSLISFNVGIELGQLTVIAGALALTLPFRGRSGYRRWVTVPASAVIALVAIVWTVQRLR